MQIGIIGAGRIGATAAGLFARAGHEVAISNSRGPESLAETAAGLGARVRATSVDEAAAFGEVVLLAIPLGAYEELPVAALAGKIVIDAMNYYPARDTSLELAGRPSSELVAQRLAGARVVKAFNTLQFQTLATAGLPGIEAAERLGLPLAGDDAAAKAVVSALIDEVGFAPFDVGGLAAGVHPQAQAGSIGHDQLHTLAETRALLVDQG